MAVDSFVSVRQKPWSHGVCVEEAMTAQEAVVLAGADFNVIQENVYDQYGIVIPKTKVNIREDTRQFLGTVGDQYSIVQNTVAVDGLNYMLGEGLQFETAGVADNGSVFFVTARMPKRLIVGDDYVPYIVLVNTHNGSGAVKIFVVPNRMICNNQLNFMTKTAKRKWSMIHKGSVTDKLGEARRSLQLMDTYLHNLEKQAEEWAKVKDFYEPEVQKALDYVLKVKDAKTDREKRTKEMQREQIIECLHADDLYEYQDTKWGFLQAIADYVDHREPIRETKGWHEKRMLDVFQGHPMIDRAVEAVWRVA